MMRISPLNWSLRTDLVLALRCTFTSLWRGLNYSVLTIWLWIGALQIITVVTLYYLTDALTAAIKLQVLHQRCHNRLWYGKLEQGRVINIDGQIYDSEGITHPAFFDQAPIGTPPTKMRLDLTYLCTTAPAGAALAVQAGDPRYW